jgi:WD40 repeat protein
MLRFAKDGDMLVTLTNGELWSLHLSSWQAEKICDNVSMNFSDDSLAVFTRDDEAFLLSCASASSQKRILSKFQHRIRFMRAMGQDKFLACLENDDLMLVGETISLIATIPAKNVMGGALLGNALCIGLTGKVMVVWLDMSQAVPKIERTATCGTPPGESWISPGADGSTFLCSCQNGNILEIDLDSMNVARTYAGFANQCFCASMSPDGSRVIGVSEDGSLSEWKRETASISNSAWHFSNSQELLVAGAISPTPSLTQSQEGLWRHTARS